MSTQHSKAAKEFLKDQQYAHWHDATFWAVRSKRDNMAYGLDEWEQLREKASAIKRHTITHLDEYLDQFATNAEKNGVEVHWAKDAQEFNEIVYGILKNHDVKKMVKSKSMLTEECEMNPYLEARGIEVVETDLGERIIQLKGQKPSHIVMPAIHLNHDNVGELFEEKGISNEKGNHDPTYLTYMARLSLRNEFLTADAGMTGANFGIAETGDIVVCTNEGNADMSTSCPKLHIAAIGLEKIIPNYDCLAVFQRMLCRAGTGQPTTTYTSHFRKARPTAHHMHIVLVDNGRSEWIANPEHWESLKCIRCGSCMNTCPVYRRSGGYSYSYFIPGPIGINLYGIATYALGHIHELQQRVGVGDGLYIAQVGHVELLANVRPVFLQYIFFAGHGFSFFYFFTFSSSLIISWNGFLGNCIILCPSAQGLRPLLMTGEGMRLAQWAMPVPKL